MSGQSERTKGGSAYRERNSTADRALEILNMFEDDVPVVSAVQVAERLGVARSTGYRYLQSLVVNRYLEEAPGGRFRLGMRVLELARLARRTHSLTDIAAPVLEGLAEAVDETALLTRRVGGVVTCLDRAESHAHRVRISYERGSTLPVNAGASALAILAFAPSAEARAILESSPLQRFTPATLVDVEAVMDRLEVIRRDGYAITRSEVDHDVLGVAAPIRDGSGKATAAISIAAVASRVSAQLEREIIAAVLAAAARVTAEVAALDA
ncbi:IclR family transcriptional regulator [Umezawaea tangerina]|uniref:IclR family transcriptional regulator n=1 Tax=Umezawaea tangerina TaxID=84725 RepID=A0A2T0STV7_9PSEU|nr:IclR family transcriptional regulator [Umezawaea tangerina]PRY36849.1 IclR family transcriptional regulator [Umezawaea tangerina]